MSRIKTHILAALMLCVPANLALAQDSLAHTFANCVGRLSAQMEFQWLMHDVKADETEALRATMIELLDLVRPDGAARDILHLRIEAKHAQATLLSRATFNADHGDAAWARRRANSEIGACATLLLS